MWLAIRMRREVLREVEDARGAIRLDHQGVAVVVRGEGDRVEEAHHLERGPATCATRTLPGAAASSALARATAMVRRYLRVTSPFLVAKYLFARCVCHAQPRRKPDELQLEPPEDDAETLADGEQPR